MLLGIFKLHPVKQQNDTGCGIACVAMCVGCSYVEAFKKFKKIAMGKAEKTFHTNASQ